jgi:hypothetical protein
MNYDQMLASMKQGLGMMKSMSKVSAKLMSLKQGKTTATAVTMHEMVGKMLGPDEKSHSMTYSGTSNDTYRKVNGKWLMAKMEWTKTKMTMDGKPFDPSQMAPPPGDR